MDTNVRSNRKNKKIPSKMCVRCGKIKPLNDFYNNRGWGAQSFHDAWCKECVGAFCVDKDTLREYCWYNNRQWADDYFDAAMKKARYTLANHTEYLQAKTKKERKQEIENEVACKQFFSMMHFDNFYRYIDNIADMGAYREFDAETSVGTARDSDPPNGYGDEQVFSRVWNGMYTSREIEYLDDYYARLEESFVLDNQNIQDYARKAAKASLDADIKYNRMRQGTGSTNDWKESQAIFDNLSKSANFAACRRKPGDSAGLGALGQIVQRIEATGMLQASPVKFPNDDIDRIIADFKHTIESVGIEGS